MTMSAPAEKVTQVVHWDGSVGTDYVEVDFNAMIHERRPYYLYNITVDNVDSANTLYVSFDRGSHWKALGSGDAITLAAPNGGVILVDYDIRLKGSAAGTDFECLFLILRKGGVPWA